MSESIPGTVYLVGAGPGDPALLTVKADRLISSAHLILHDDLVSREILSLAGPRAEVLNVGKRCGAKGITQSEIDQLMIDGAQRGLRVVRLKSGDPAIFGRLAEEIDALQKAGIPFEVVPGITAGIAAAASLNVSLTDRRKSSRVVIVTGHHAQAGGRPVVRDWQSLAREDATLVIYMPGHEFVSLRRELLAAGLPADLPAVAVSKASTSEQRHALTTLGDLDGLPQLESPTILLLGRCLQAARSSASTKESLAAELDPILSLL